MISLSKFKVTLLLKALAVVFILVSLILFTGPFVKLGWISYLSDDMDESYSAFGILKTFKSEYTRGVFWALMIVIAELITLTIVVVYEVYIYQRVSKKGNYINLDVLPKHFNSTYRVVLIVEAIISGLVVLILNLCVLKTTTLDDGTYDLAKVGWGAIASGLLFFFGCIVEAGSHVLLFFDSPVIVQNKIENQNSSDDSNISSHLRELDKLKSEGLITEDDYNAKKKQILNI